MSKVMVDRDELEKVCRWFTANSALVGAQLNARGNWERYCRYCGAGKEEEDMTMQHYADCEYLTALRLLSSIEKGGAG